MGAVRDDGRGRDRDLAPAIRIECLAGDGKLDRAEAAPHLMQEWIAAGVKKTRLNENPERALSRWLEILRRETEIEQLPFAVAIDRQHGVGLAFLQRADRGLHQ